eukprot:33832_1
MSYKLTVILSILCISAALTDYYANFLFSAFAILYLIPTYLIITKPSNNVRATHSKPLYFVHLGYDITIILSTILSITLIIILIINSFEAFNKHSTITLSIIIILFAILSIILSIRNSINIRQMNQRTKAIIANGRKENNKMKAIIVNEFGPIDKVIEMVSDQPKPLLLNNDKNKLLIKVLACSLSPSDYRMWSGSASKIKYPPYGFPYIPLGDVCGIIQDVTRDISNEFQIGDYIVATWDMFGIDCLAEYAVISSKFATVLKDFNDSRIDSIHAAALANSCIIAYDDVLLAHNNNKITNADRILVLGGSGGMGTSIIQFIRNIAPNCYIASTSTDEKLLSGNILRVNRFINYKKEYWWEINEFKNNPFDKIFDCAEGSKAFYKANQNNVIKTNVNNGIFIAIVINDWYIKGYGFWSLIKSFLIPMLMRSIKNKFRTNSEAKYIATGPNVTKDKLNNIIEMYVKGEFEVILDPEPFEFTIDNVKKAFKKHENRKGHGKIVIKVADH